MEKMDRSQPAYCQFWYEGTRQRCLLYCKSRKVYTEHALQEHECGLKRGSNDTFPLPPGDGKKKVEALRRHQKNGPSRRRRIERRAAARERKRQDEEEARAYPGRVRPGHEEAPRGPAGPPRTHPPTARPARDRALDHALQLAGQPSLAQLRAGAEVRFGGLPLAEAPSEPLGIPPVQAFGGTRSIRIASARAEQKANLEEEEGLWDQLKEDRRRYKQKAEEAKAMRRIVAKHNRHLERKKEAETRAQRAAEIQEEDQSTPPVTSRLGPWGLVKRAMEAHRLHRGDHDYDTSLPSFSPSLPDFSRVPRPEDFPSINSFHQAEEAYTSRTGLECLPTGARRPGRKGLRYRRDLPQAAGSAEQQGLGQPGTTQQGPERQGAVQPGLDSMQPGPSILPLPIMEVQLEDISDPE